MIIFSNGQSIFRNLLKSHKISFLISYIVHNLSQFESKKKRSNILLQFILVITYRDKEKFQFHEIMSS